ncbi:DUF2382 domain-containing protein [Nucisporomicrobium flavum]|uniref:DUF2382 domain-containing protein n=1 Tax=Nucisporomicrobium flavum TaxID=2785915 RepID=UPI0018F2DEA4|nr:PRC and DUF2382 domain-containing protein [Nucisporomicrobium flavum]
MIAQEQIHSLYGREVYDRDGDKIGSIGQVWGDGVGRPAWASVKTGLFGLNESMIPLQDADLQGDRLIVPFEKAVVKDAPNVDAADDEPLAEDEVTRLYDYYNLSWDDSYHAYQAGAAAGNASYAGTQDRETVGYDTSGPTTDDAMTRSEERLNVGTEREQVGRARLRKYVVTEQQQVTVPVSHEEVRIEREPITEANADRAFSGPDISEEEHEVTLHAERPVVDTEAVPVERVRLNKETVTEQQTVGGEVRKEHIEADVPGEQGRRTLG